MRPFRLVCTVLALFLITFSLLLSLFQPVPNEKGGTSGRKREEYKSRWSFGAPASLFPPSAIISLTDDNTTFFLARPAAYGPLLPDDGLTGQLWVGSGFADDVYVRAGMMVAGQAELGCSDIPGWTAERAKIPVPSPDTGSNLPGDLNGIGDHKDDSNTPDNKLQENKPSENDDTDDFLHYPLQGRPIIKSRGQDPSGAASEHANIQSLQESAAISGKVVLLSRGGCGFSEKTKWVQRRGGVALIVGDYTRGGHLIQMSTTEDTSNITIPSIFTAYTSAHLLSSLLPPSSRTPNNGFSTRKKDQKDGGKTRILESTSNLPKTPVSVESPTTRKAAGKEQNTSHQESHSSWLRSIAYKLGLIGEVSNHKDSRRPPNSGTISWIQSDDWNDDSATSPNAPNTALASNKQSDRSNTKTKIADGFVIGVNDWRDPDMVAQPKASNTPSTTNDHSKTSGQSGKANGYSGGSRAPESGVYESSKPGRGSEANSKSEAKSSKTEALDTDKGWLHNLLGSSQPNSQAEENQKAKSMYKHEIAPHYVQDQEFEDEKRKDNNEHEGLWITIIPASASTSPFFDTLLVLVVSPLVTLSIVYALLLLRSRIRRRRWRAPRSVVDRLPVRTYHTMSYSSSNSSSEAVSPNHSSQTTPLLQSTVVRPRNRSATVADIRHEAAASLNPNKPLLPPREKSSANNTFKRKYQGRQVECVVCLEEYIDAQSQVMSLPCGHEFHAECITPWLTTRRRTCPICKGDVVRSMDRTSTPSSAASSYTSLVLLAESESSTPRASPASQATITPQIQMTHASNLSPLSTPAEPRSENTSNAIPIQGSTEEQDDLAATLVGSRQSGDGICMPGHGTNPSTDAPADSSRRGDGTA